MRRRRHRSSATTGRATRLRTRRPRRPQDGKLLRLQAASLAPREARSPLHDGAESGATCRWPRSIRGLRLSSVRWLVRNQLGADGLPVEHWAAGADSLLRDQATVRSATVHATYEEHELPLENASLAALSLAVVVDADDALAAAALVERTVLAALYGLVGEPKLAGRRTTGTPRRPGRPIKTAPGTVKPTVRSSEPSKSESPHPRRIRS